MGRRPAEGDEDDEDVAEDEDGVEGREDRKRGELRDGAVRVDGADDDEGAEEEEAHELLRRHEVALLAGARCDRTVALRAVEGAEQDEDDEGAGGVVGHRKQARPDVLPLDRLAELLESMERLAQEDEREDLERLAERVREGMARAEDERDDLEEEQERGGDVDRVEMADGNAMEALGEEAEPLKLDDEQDRHEATDQKGPDRPPGGGRVPRPLESVEEADVRRQVCAHAFRMGCLPRRKASAAITVSASSRPRMVRREESRRSVARREPRDSAAD